MKIKLTQDQVEKMAVMDKFIRTSKAWVRKSVKNNGRYIDVVKGGAK